jgi:ParB family chromosome partitioning protein
VIVSGERRWRAASLAGVASLACVEVKGEPTPESILEDQLVENCLRSDLTPVEAARAFKALMARRGYSARQLAETLALSHMSVNRALALLDLPASVQEHVEHGVLAPSVAVAVSRLPADVQEEVAAAAVAEGLTRSEVSDLVRAVKAKRPAPAPRPDPLVLDVGDGVTVTVRWRKPTGVSVAQLLRRALKAVAGQERPDAA